MLLIAFFIREGVLYRELVPPGKKVKDLFQMQILKRLKQSEVNDLIATILAPSARKMSLYNNNAPSHASRVWQTWFAENNNPLLHQLSYSSGLATSDFSLSKDVSQM